MGRRISLAFSALLLLAPLSPAQASDVIESLNRAVFALERGEAERAFEFLEATVARAIEAGGGDTGERIAAEWALDELVKRRARYQPEVFDAWLRTLDSSRAWPALRGALALGAAVAARERGDVSAISEAHAEAGTITSWRIAGPFANERGAGLATPYPPESGFDPDTPMDGKDRRVAWRPQPLDARDGRLRFGVLMESARQAAAYALTAVHAGEEGEAILWLSAGGAVKVFWNGAEVHASSALESYAQDQDAIVVDVRAGWNLLLVKSAAQEEPGELMLRVTGTAGGPVAGLRASALSADIEAAARAQRGDARVLELPWDGSDELIASLEASPALVLAWTARRLVLRTDKAERRATRAAVERRAAAAPERTPLLDFCIAQALDVPSRIQAERDDNGMRLALLRCLEADANYLPALKMLARHYNQRLPVRERALDYARRGLAIDPQDAVLAMEAAYAGRAAGPDEPGLSMIRAIPPARMTDEVLGYAVRRYMSEGHRFHDARTLVEAVLARRPGAPEVRALWRTILDTTHAAQAEREHLRRDIILDPLNRDAYVSLAEMTPADATGAREAVIDEALGLFPEHRGLLNLKIEAARRRGDVEGALAALDRVLDIFPTDKDARRYREFLDAESSPFDDRFPVDMPAVLAAARPAGDNLFGDSHRYILRETVINVNPDGTAQTFTRNVIRILNQAGIDAFKGVPIQGGWGSSVRVRAARLHRMDGTVLDVDTSGVSFFGGWIRLPALAIGDVIEVAWRADETSQSFFGNYFGHVHVFSPLDFVEAEVSRFTLMTPRNRRFHVNRLAGVGEPVKSRFDDGRDALSFELTNLKRIEREPAMPDLKAIAPAVEISTYGDWRELASWWWNLIREQHVVTDEMKSKVNELIAGKTTDIEKIKALYGFIVNDIRYVAWEFGVHGYKPYKTDVIFERRFGDCKDKAILMNALLEVAGIESYPVLINLENHRTPEDLSLAMVEHFNHCIAYLPAGEDHGPMFLDMTASFHPADVLPGGDRDAEVVIVKAGEALRATTPSMEPEAHMRTAEADMIIQPNGDAEARVKVHCTGVAGAEFRATFETPSEHERNLEDLVSAWFGKVKFEEFEVLGGGSLAVDPGFTAKARVSGVAAAADDRLSFRLSPARSPYTAYLSRETRHFDLILPPPVGESFTVRWTLPADYVVGERPADVVIEEAFGVYRLTSEVKDGVLEVQRYFRLSTRRVSPAEYPAFREFHERVRRADEETLTLRKGQQ